MRTLPPGTLLTQDASEFDDVPLPKRWNWRSIALATLRWIALLPACVIVAILSDFLSRWSFSRVQPETVHDLLADQNYGFGGHYVQGPIFLLTSSIARGVVTVGAAAFVAPVGKRYTAFAVATIYAMLALVTLGVALSRWNNGALPTETTIRMTLEMLPAAIAALVMAFSVPLGATDKTLRFG